MRQTVEYARSIEKQHNKHFRFTITTNGVGLNDENIDYINREMGNCVLSLDGRPEVNDKNRITPSGSGSYDIILPKFKKLLQSRGKDKDYYVRGTFTRDNLDFAEDVLHIADQGFDSISVEPVVSEPGTSYSLREEDLPRIFAEYERLAEQMLQRDVYKRQVYTGASSSNITRASSDTAGECIYYNGALIDAVYHAADGGATESSLNTWGTDLPYLVGKKDPYELQIDHPSSSWQYEISSEEMTSMVRNLGYDCQRIVKVEITEYTAMGNVNAIVLTDSAGETFRFTKDNVRVFQNIPGVTYFSRRFTVVAPGQSGSSTAAAGGYSVQDGTGVSQHDTLYAITSEGVEAVTRCV